MRRMTHMVLFAAVPTAAAAQTVTQAPPPVQVPAERETDPGHDRPLPQHPSVMAAPAGVVVPVPVTPPLVVRTLAGPIAAAPAQAAPPSLVRTQASTVQAPRLQPTLLQQRTLPDCVVVVGKSAKERKRAAKRKEKATEVAEDTGTAVSSTVGYGLGTAVAGPIGGAAGGVILGHVGKAVMGLFKGNDKDKAKEKAEAKTAKAEHRVQTGTKENCRVAANTVR